MKTNTVGNAPEKGKLIVIEGLDGVGKGTQIELLVKKLRGAGKKVYRTAEPTNTTIGGMIRDALSESHPRTATELAALFLADRISHNQNDKNGIRKFIDQGVMVVCDRYYYSSFAYQGVDVDLQWVMDINLKCDKILTPDICIFLDLDASACRRRAGRERLHFEIFEKDVRKMNQIRKGFYDAFDILEKQGYKDNICVIDASRKPQAVSHLVFEKVMKMIEN